MFNHLGGPSLNGMHIVTNHILTTRAEDWSGVRSAGRARRRLKQGHKQRIRYYDKPTPKAMVIGGVIYCHPDMVAELTRVAG